MVGKGESWYKAVVRRPSSVAIAANRSPKSNTSLMHDPIRILIAEDLATDAELAQREIRQIVADCSFQIVDTREDYLAAIETFQPDLIISDYHMPRFDGLTALKLAQEHAPLTPLIILTGSINEDTAVECMKAGASDYVLKEQIRRLSQSVVHAIEARQLREEHRRAEETQAQLEAQLRQSQKMESIGRLAGGIAHDFNNLLTVIGGYCDLTRAELDPDNPLDEYMEQIRKACDRAAALTRQLLAFSRKQILNPTTIDLNSLVEQLRKMLVRIIGEDISLTTTLQPELWPVTADPGQIEQVFLNLVVNARDAMPTGGQLTIETRNATATDCAVLAHSDLASRPCVLVEIADNGAGMDEYVRSRIFEPFFTTKAPGQGTGLGLATVYGIVRQSGGEISVESKSGAGTTFRIYLPSNPRDTVKPVSDVKPVAIFDSGHETILLVEDDDQLRRLALTSLRAQGYTVFEARQGVEALTMIEQYTAPIDLLITDVVMPQISGQALAEQIRAMRPQIKVLYMSGYTDDTVFRHGLLTTEMAFLAKPFSPQTLAAYVRKVLDS